MEIVATVGGAILSASLQPLFDKLASHDLLNYAREGKVLAELKKWESMLRKIYAVLEDAEEKQAMNRLVKIWVSELRDLAYDVEDVLDEFATEVLRRKLMAEPLSKVRKFINFSACFAGMSPNAIKFNALMLSKIKGITVRLEEIIAQKDELDLRESCVGRSNIVRERNPTTSLVNEAKIYGREEDQKAILELLNANASDDDICVLPIIGMGGVGKTTLAQLVFNSAGSEFDVKAWVSVGEDFDVLTMTKMVLQMEGSDAQDLNFLQVKLKEKLDGKKFLVVLDDVWNENYEDWTLLYSPFEVGAPGSRIIVTTRNQGVASMVGTVSSHFLKELPYDDCLSVFSQHALGSAHLDLPWDLEEIGKEIVQKCQGLPLAAKVLGGLLRGKLDRGLWKEVLESKIWDLPEEKCGILPALRLSYSHLPSHLKRCFAYCAILPKNYEFGENELVLLWMAEGLLLHQKGKKHMEELGHEHFRDLLSRSFFQQSSNSKSQYVMHDLMSDLSQFICGETCFVLDDKFEGAKSCGKVRHSSFTPQNTDIAQRFDVFYEMRSLRTFLSLPKSRSSFLYSIPHNYLSSKVLHDLVPQLTCLRVLSLAGYWLMDLPSSIGALKHLRYLNLSYTEIEMLPESVNKLLNLQTLRLKGCRKLLKLSTDIGNLSNLQHLDISDTTRLQAMPLQIVNLTNLRTLPKFIVGNGSGIGIAALKSFPFLQGKLQITGLDGVEHACDAELAKLNEKQGLDELELKWTDNFCGLRNESDEHQILNSLRPHTDLASLSIRSYGGTIFPSWIADPSFNSMIHLQLSNCRNITSLPSLWLLHSLRDLNIEGIHGVREVGVEFYGDGFSCLETLKFVRMSEWKQWSWSSGLDEKATGYFPNLRELTIIGCSKLEGKFPRSLPSLEKLAIQHCPLLEDFPEALPLLVDLTVEECQEIVLGNMPVLPSLTTLKIKEISGLVNLNRALGHDFVALEDLQIKNCGELTCMWQEGNLINKPNCLKQLKIRNCEQLLSLIDGEEGLVLCNLEVLVLEKCCSLEKLPNGLHSLTSLRELIVKECPKVKSFSATCLPSSLEVLSIVPGFRYNFLRPLRQINLLFGDYKAKFYTGGCPSLTLFPIGQFPDSLKSLYISHFTTRSLELSLHNRLLHLTKLAVTNCPELESFPEDGLPVPNLVEFIIWECQNLRSLPNGMQNLKSLQFLEIYDCGCLVSFPERGLPPSLDELRIFHCGGLASLSGIGLLPNLNKLVIRNCGIVSFGQGDLPSSITMLEIWECTRLTQPISEWGLQRLTSLSDLTINNAGASTDTLVSFPDDDGLWFPTSVNSLWIIGFKNLKSISSGLEILTSLQHLRIIHCPKLQALPNKGLPATLGYLGIKSCPLLEAQCLNEKGDYWPNIVHIPIVSIH